MPAPPSQAVCGPPRPYWTPAEVLGCPFGVLICAICPGDAPETAIAALDAAEREYARGLEPDERRREWIGGRLCLARAVARVSASRRPMLSSACGAPNVPPGVAASISHKGPLALALARETHGGVGVDVECIRERDEALERKVLTASERVPLSELDAFAAARHVVAHFAVKEAIYKALRPDQQLDLEFDNVELAIPNLVPRTWLKAGANLVGRPACPLTAALLLDGEWVLAAALREG